MYIEPTTYNDRRTVHNIMAPLMTEIETAREIINGVWVDYFSMKDAKPFQSGNYEEIERLLRVAETTIFDAILQYALTVGDTELCGVSPHKDSIERMQSADRVNDLQKQLFDREREIGGERCEKLRARRNALSDLPDTEAIPALEALLKEATA